MLRVGEKLGASSDGFLIKEALTRIALELGTSQGSSGLQLA